jgi:hypothetical protein
MKNMKKQKSKLFVVDSNWRPTKVREIDMYLKEMCYQASILDKGESFPIPILELKKRYGWKNDKSIANSIRHILKKDLNKQIFENINVHEVKDGNGKITFIRVRKRDEAK